MLKTRWNNYNCKITDDIKILDIKHHMINQQMVGTITVSATITDTAGNTSAEGKDSAIIRYNSNTSTNSSNN